MFYLACIRADMPFRFRFDRLSLTSGGLRGLLPGYGGANLWPSWGNLRPSRAVFYVKITRNTCIVLHIACVVTYQLKDTYLYIYKYIHIGLHMTPSIADLCFIWGVSLVAILRQLKAIEDVLTSLYLSFIFVSGVYHLWQSWGNLRPSRTYWHRYMFLSYF